MVLAILLLIASFWLTIGVLLAVATLKSGVARADIVIGDAFIITVMVLAAIALL